MYCNTERQNQSQHVDLIQTDFILQLSVKVCRDTMLYAALGKSAGSSPDCALLKNLFFNYETSISRKSKIFAPSPLRPSPMVMFLFLLLPFLGLTQVDPDCIAPSSCSNLSIEVVKQDANVTTVCDPSVLCGVGSRFTQIRYKVYIRLLRAFSADSPDEFLLNYASLNVAVKLNATDQASPGTVFSQVNASASNTCFNALAQSKMWSAQKVEFDP
jgi:hypothetical protein